MRIKAILSFCMLMLCMSIFSVTAFGVNDTEPPVVNARTSGESLLIDVSDIGSGVEAVFIGGKRINYRVDSALDLPLKDYAGSEESISLYAIDFAGNRSQTVNIKNPLYTSPSAPKPFTPGGSATVTDNATGGDGKEFFTFTTPNDSVFYLVIDRQRNGENVYLLNDVTESDLMALTKEDKPKQEVVKPTPEPTPQPEPQPEQPKPQKNNTGTITFVILAVAAAGGAGYYFKVYKPKQQATSSDEEFEDEEELEFEDEEELEFEEEADDEMNDDVEETQ